MGSLGRIMGPRAVLRFALAVVLAAAAGCSPIYRNNGYVPSEVDLKEVVVGQTTRDEVDVIVGRPSSSGVLAGSAWYYVGSRFKYFGARAPKEIDRQVVAISFDEQNIVTNVERFGLEKGQIVTISRRTTDSNIKGVGFLRQLMGNLGNFNPATALGGPSN